MKTYLIKFVIIFFAATIGFFIGRSRESNNIEVMLRNSSNKDISSIQLTREPDIIKNLKKGESRKIKFHARSVTGYALKVKFEDNSTIEGEEGYVEPGYKITESINNKKITSDFHFGY